MNTTKRVLLLSSDTGLFRQVQSLETEGFEFRNEKSLAQAAHVMQDFNPGILLLDTERNRELAVLEFCYYIKSDPRHESCKILVLSDRRDEVAEVAAFDAGADDFIPKPLRLKSLARRMRAGTDHTGRDIFIHSDNGGNTSSVKIDPESYSVFLGTRSVHVSRKEFELLYMMASRPGKVFNRVELYEQVWKKKYAARDRTIDVHILRLRRKLGKNYIQTQKGVGYRFSTEG
jgi:two-component system alkaline phosphatase synthesis response regulator PhoP